MHAKRIRRLERAADRIAGGRFDEPVTDTGNDELGDLANAFERMRGRLGQLDRARSEFIANASHELRTPLFSLGGFLELMADEEVDEATRLEFLETMREQVDRLAKLATDLLDLSRLDAGRMHVEHEPVDLGEVARVVAAEFSARAERKHAVDTVVKGARSHARTSCACTRSSGLAGQRAHVHTPEGTRDAAYVGGARARASRGRGRRAGVSGPSMRRTCSIALPGRRHDRFRQRPRARDRPGARAHDGRRGRARVAAGPTVVRVVPRAAPTSVAAEPAAAVFT